MHIFLSKISSWSRCQGFPSVTSATPKPLLYFTLGRPQVGRVKIQVYRGPSKGTGYDAFAPWGYYNTQPVDLGPHH